MTLCYIGLGSNLATPYQQLNSAVKAISALENASKIAVSSYYHSKPMGPQDQPDYVNAVASLTWSSDPISLLDSLQKIELEQGRERKEHRWGPRTLDLDILLFGQRTIETDRLTVPHYGMEQREFVLYPLYEIAPELILPKGHTLSNLIKTCPLNGLIKSDKQPSDLAL